MDVKTTPGRSVCVACGRKRERQNMVKHGQHWTCKTCLSGEMAPVIRGEHIPSSAGFISADHRPKLRVLNLYAGIGGNRALWPAHISVTAVKYHPKVAAAYQKLYPNDKVILGDAHAYLLKHYSEFDFIWASPPCQSHSRMNYWKLATKKRYPDMSLYQEIIFLKEMCRVKFLVENVNPYYTPLVQPDYIIGRHAFWCNFKIDLRYFPNVDGFIDMKMVKDIPAISDWLGIKLETNIYLNAKNPLQVYRNCVHPKIGLSIFNDAFNLK